MLSEEQKQELAELAVEIFPKSFYDHYKRPGAYDEYRKYLEERAALTTQSKHYPSPNSSTQSTPRNPDAE
jgi:hypothetical protein